MRIFRRSFGTIRIVWWSLFPPSTKKGGFEKPPLVNPLAASGRIVVRPEEVRHFCAHFSAWLDENGKLELYFVDCYFPAAFFLMFRLKREGFSRCRACREGRGIVLTAVR